MNLAEFTSALSEQTSAISILLPTGAEVPAHFHITDVGVITHDMIDCGGQHSTTQHVQAQLWLGEDTEHRMSAKTLSGILGASQSIFDKFAGIESAPVHIEYQLNSTISKYMVESVESGCCGVTIHLSNVHAVCLELERNPESTMCGNDANSSGCC